MTTKRSTILAALAGGALLLAACGSGGSGEDADDGASDVRGQVRLATLEQGSGWNSYGAAFSEMWRQDMPNLQVQVLPFAGGVANIDLVAENQAEYGLTFSPLANWAQSGINGFEESSGYSAVAGGFDEYYVGIVTREGFEADSLEEVAEQELPLRLYTLAPGSAGEYFARATLEAYGLSYDEIEANGGSVEQTSFDVIKNAFRDGQADMMIQVITANHPATTEIATSSDIKILPVSEEIYESVSELGVGYGEIPAGSFTGVDEAVPALTLSTLLIARDDRSEEEVYEMTRSLIENAEELGEMNASLAGFTPERAAADDAITIPLHPGAERYYEEEGLL
ncbi:MAG: TAXI family TRAP transporter solute-binding subunit [Actinomycetaceae bacterium]